MIEYTVRVFDNRTEWHLNGKRHREDGPAIEYVGGGSKYWYLDGKFHREDGPAVEYTNGNKYWYRNGKFHREDGPAVERGKGDKLWYLDGNNYSELDYNKEMAKRNNTCNGKVVEIDGKKYQLTAI